jgi:alpha-ketoglutarate-dependent taurine dioxygenase
MDINKSAFRLSNKSAYQQWRETKLTNFNDDTNALMVTIEDITTPQHDEILTLSEQIKRYNIGFYSIKNPPKNPVQNKHDIATLATLLGLSRLDHNLCADKDKFSSITVSKHKNQHQYIPYSNRRLSWHTDGYYNTSRQQINAFILHCEQPAKTGGKSLLLDHEMAYILLRDENPKYIHALMNPEAMTIPANILNGKTIRAAQSGPVFSFNPISEHLHMRYSARQRNIEWQQDSITLEAKAFLETLWEHGSPYILQHTLQANQGIICNNVLHCRTAFKDHHNPEKKRLLYRGRYLDRVSTYPLQQKK